GSDGYRSSSRDLEIATALARLAIRKLKIRNRGFIRPAVFYFVPSRNPGSRTSAISPVPLPPAGRIPHPIGMDLQLKDKTALVTGSTAGIGFAIATALAKEGARVIVNGRTQARVNNALRSSGASHGLAADLSTAAGVAAVIEKFPSVDI